MPTSCHFNITKTKLEAFRSALQAASSSPESHWSSWKSCWETVSDSLDQAEARAYAAGDIEAATSVLRLNKLIQWWLKEDWDQLGQADGQTIGCVLLDWTDQWDKFKVVLNGYHVEIFQQSIADLVELQQCTDLLPEATWAQVAQEQVAHLVADVSELLQRTRCTESQ